MNGMIRILGIALLLQIAITAFFLLQEDQLATYVPDEPFLGISLEELTKIVIDNKDNEETVTLVKEDNRWLLESHFGFPVAPAKMNTLGSDLLEVKRPLAVGSTPIAAKQFEVSEEKYKQKIELFQAGEEAAETVYLGTSPGFKKVHARKAGEEATFAIPFSPYDIQTKQSSWVDRDFYKMSREDIAGIQFADISLTLNEQNEPSLTDLGDSESLKEEAVNSFLNLTTRPAFSEVVGTELKPEYGLNEADIEYSVQMREGEPMIFKVAQSGDEEKFYMTRSDLPYVVEVTKFHFENLQKQLRSTLVEQKAEQQAEESSPAAGESGDDSVSSPIEPQ